MEPDPIVEVVRRTRDAYALELGYDVNAIVQSLKEEETAQGTETISLPARGVQESSTGVKSGISPKQGL